jgi:hypothetical protein
VHDGTWENSMGSQSTMNEHSYRLREHRGKSKESVLEGTLGQREEILG